MNNQIPSSSEPNVCIKIKLGSQNNILKAPGQLHMKTHPAAMVFMPSTIHVAAHGLCSANYNPCQGWIHLLPSSSEARGDVATAEPRQQQVTVTKPRMGPTAALTGGVRYCCIVSCEPHWPQDRGLTQSKAWEIIDCSQKHHPHEKAPEK